MTAAATTVVRLVDSRHEGGTDALGDLRRAYRDSAPGDLIELWESDHAFTPVVRLWASVGGNEVVSVEERGGEVAILLRVLHR